IRQHTAQQHLRNVLSYLNMHVLGQPEVFLQYNEGLFGADDQIVNADSRAFLQGFVDRFLGLIEHLKR
uniref:NADPH-dependent FMN reductase n=1 Tax=Xanthomonas fragariae TaxID=48664 RepID=UPI003CCEC27E